MTQQAWLETKRQQHRERVQRRLDRENRFTLSDAGQAFLSWLIASGMPIPEVDAPAVLPFAVIAAVALVDGEDIAADPEAPGYPMSAWMIAHKNEIAEVLPVFLGARAS